MRHLKINKAADGLAILILDHADEPMNVVNDAFIDDMEEATRQLAADASVTGVVLTSGKKAFMAGADLKQLVNSFGQLSKTQAFAFSQRATHMHRAIEQSGKPWVALINGLALGGGFELALACHYRILVDDIKSQVGLPEVNVGLLPGSGGTMRLAILAGMKSALDLLLTGRSVTSTEALNLKIVDQVASAATALERARTWLATKPDAVRPWDKKGWVPPHKKGLTDPEVSAAYMMATASIAKKGYHAPARLAILAAVFEGLQLPFDKALAVEGKYFANLLTSPIARNIIRTSFISKKAAEKGVRRPKAVPQFQVKKLGVLGAGMMGAAIAYVAANAGITVVLLDQDLATAEKGRNYTSRVQATLIERGKLTQEKADRVLALITPGDNFGLLEGCDFVVEAVIEDTASKADVTHKAETVMPRGAIFASNTSTLPITRLAAVSRQPDQFIGLHFLSPVDRMDLVEVIMGTNTSQTTLAKALDFVAQLRKTPIVVNDSRGFYTSRVFQTFIHEGGAMIREGVPAAVIENAAKAIGMPTGPLAMMDEVTLDLPLKIVEAAMTEEENAYSPPAGVSTLRKMRDTLGRGVRKWGAGFYDYPSGERKHLWKGLTSHFPVANNFDVEEIEKRFLYIQAMESARCIEEGVVETPRDADVGSVYGWGFPLWTGGTLSYIDTIGIKKFVEEADKLAEKHGTRFLPSPWLRQRALKGEPFYAENLPADREAAK